MRKRAPEKQCINPLCAIMHHAITRGLCPTCYATVHQLVQEKRTTWARLEAMGKVSAVQRRQAIKASNVIWFLTPPHVKTLRREKMPDKATTRTVSQVVRGLV